MMVIFHNGLLVSCYICYLQACRNSSDHELDDGSGSNSEVETGSGDESGPSVSCVVNCVGEL